MDRTQTVIFDLDGTLMKVNTFTRFVGWLFRSFPSLRFRLIMIVVCRKLRFISHAVAKQQILALCDSKVKNESLEAFVDELIKHNLNQAVAQDVAKYCSEGLYVVMATAAPELYAAPLARKLNFSDVIATPFGGDECKGEQKLFRCRQWLTAHQSHIHSFYTDHTDDLPLAEYASQDGGAIVWVKDSRK